jgi:AcrR family transcriptional regulator
MPDEAPQNQEIREDNQEVRKEEGVNWISIERVADALGVKRPAVYYYVRKLQIPTKKFEFDRKAYIPITDFDRIKAAKKAAIPGLR